MRVKYWNFVLVILMGIIMSSGAVAKILFGFDIDSDWFWFLAGVGLMSEGVISLRRRRRLDRKNKAASRSSAS